MFGKPFRSKFRAKAVYHCPKDDYQWAAIPEKDSPYGAKAKACPICGDMNPIRFDSKKEAAKYRDLLLAKRCGVVKEIELQPRYLVQEGFERNGVKHRPIYYVGDFLVTWENGKQSLLDSKGVKTPVYRLKRKMFEARYPDLTIEEC